MHKTHATERGVAWEFTFEEWLAIWEKSGHLAERGRESGQYVMARHGDVGPYASWNVSIVRAEDNTREAAATKKRKPYTGVSLRKPGAARPWQARYMKILGFFSTETEAIAAREAAMRK